MTVRLVCPTEGKAFTIQSRTWEELEGQTIRCPVCKTVHNAIQHSEEHSEEPSDERVGTLAERPSEEPLFPVAGIVLATFLGSLAGGAIVMALNFRRLGKKGAALQSVVWGVLGTIAVVFLAFKIPDSVPGMVLWVPSLLLMYLLARSFFGEALEQQEAAGVDPAGMGKAALIGLACLAVLVGIVLAYTFLLWSPFPGTRLELGINEVYYSGDATESDARRVADTLKDDGFLDETDAKTVHVEKTGERYTVGFVLVDGAWERSDVQGWFREIGVKLADAGLGRPMTVHLHDDTGELKETLRVE